jgi:RNA polymerase sigma-70 factor (ECF subfamily)
VPEKTKNTSVRRVDSALLSKLHESLRAGDPTATARLFEVIHRPIRRTLRRLHSQASEDQINDATVDAVLSYIKRPEQYRPDKQSLFSYLVMSARGDLRNLLARERRRRLKEILRDDVELLDDGGNNDLETNFIEPADIERSLVNLERLLNDPKDRAMVRLMAAGERSTIRFAEALGIAHLSVDEQRKLVKREKDRVKKWIERHATDPRDDEQ